MLFKPRPKRHKRRDSAQKRFAETQRSGEETGVLSGFLRGWTFRFAGEREAFLEQNRDAYDALGLGFEEHGNGISAITQKPEELIRIARRSFELRQELSFLFESNEKNFVYCMTRNKGVFLTATPIDVSQILRETCSKSSTRCNDFGDATGWRLITSGSAGCGSYKDRALRRNSITESSIAVFAKKMPDVRDAGFGARPR